MMSTVPAPAAAPAPAPMAAPFPPPAIAPIAAPIALPAATFARSLPALDPLLSFLYASVRIRIRWPSEVDSFTSSMPRCESRPALPPGTASTTLPSTRAPRSAMMKPSITSGRSSVAKKLSPISLRDADSVSPMRTASVVPAASTTVLGTRRAGSGGEGGSGAGAGGGDGGCAAGSGAGVGAGSMGAGVGGVSTTTGGGGAWTLATSGGFSRRTGEGIGDGFS